MRQLPVSLLLEGRSVLVVGGGDAALAKIRLLQEAGARVVAVAEQPCDALAEAAMRQELVLARRSFEAADVAGCAAVFSASGVDALDRAVAAAANAAGVPVNAVDRADLSSFSMPAVVRRGDIAIGISTGGAAPLLAARLRALIERALPARLDRLVAFAAGFRDAVKSANATPSARRRLWERIFDGSIAELVLAGDERRAREQMLRAINQSAAEASRPVVHIVGAGPGDPELLTLAAVRAMQRADVVFHDELVAAEILSHVRREARRVNVGKLKGRLSCSQETINARMAEAALAGKRVVRLKGGDPLIFGRGGEEIDALRRRGIEAVVVPGITAAIGCAAAAGIPLTDRRLASMVTFLSGHGADGGIEPDWQALVRSQATLAIYMGFSQASRLAGRLIDAGAGTGTPVAVVARGTRREQRLLFGELRDLGRLVEDAGAETPALIIVGDVVRLSAAWHGAVPQVAAG